MNKKAIIYDLDNTIYPVSAVGDSLFEPFLTLITQCPEHDGDFDAIKSDMFRKPFQAVAAEHHFSARLTQMGLDFLRDVTYNGPISYFDDYPEIKNIKAERFLVTTGFYNLQYSKIRGMGIENDFAEIHVVDPLTSTQTKKDVFADIMHRHNYALSDVLVVGDDPESEIKAALELGIDAVLYDKPGRHSDTKLLRITNYAALAELF